MEEYQDQIHMGEGYERGIYEIEDEDDLAGSWTASQYLVLALLVVIGLVLANDVYNWLAASNWPVKP